MAQQQEELVGTTEEEEEEKDSTAAALTLPDWTALPPEILSLIYSRLFSIKNRCFFKLVCTTWNKITSVGVSLPLPPPHYSQFCISPCLINTTNSSSLKLFHSAYNDFYYLDLPELKDAEIRSSNFGWLLLSRGLDLFFFEPINREKIDLPRPRLEEEEEGTTFASVSFSCPPTTSLGRLGCRVLAILNTNRYAIFSFKDFSWEVDDLSESWLATDCCIWPIVFLDKCFYGLNRRFYGLNRSTGVSDECFYGLNKFGDVFVLQLNRFLYDYDEVFTPINPRREFRQRYMAQVDGEQIWAVLIDDKEVLVMKLDLDEMVWTPLQSLGDKCFYVAENGSFVETASPDSGLGNKIFFNNFYGKAGVLYSMSTCNYYSIDCDSVIKDRCALTETTGSNTAWLKPKRPIVFDSTTDSDPWLDWI